MTRAIVTPEYAPPVSSAPRRWRVWDLDGELRYKPVVAQLPASDLPICEVGSGPAGVAAWTSHQVIGVNPGADDRHGEQAPPANFRRVEGDGANIPLPDKSVCACVAVDTFDHIPREARPAVISETERVTADSGRVIVMGPTGPDAAEGDHYVLGRWRAKEPNSNIALWLGEHEEIGLPAREEIAGMFGGRAARITATGVYNIKLWRTAHRILLGDFPQKLGHDRVHPIVWAPVGFIARRFHRGPCYRQLVVAELGPPA